MGIVIDFIEYKVKKAEENEGISKFELAEWAKEEEMIRGAQDDLQNLLDVMEDLHYMNNDTPFIDPTVDDYE
jgi:hypothetical protein